MSLVVAYDDLTPGQIKRRTDANGIGRTTNNFFRATSDTPDAPTAFLNRHDAGRRISAHFHTVDQFQVVTEGTGKFGKHDVAPYTVHFSRAYTPYGPLMPSMVTGWAFFTLRCRYDPGAQHIPAKIDQLKNVPDRRPWQASTKVEFPAQVSEISLQSIPGIKDEQGLFSCTLSMPPNSRITAPAPSDGDGQFVIVVKGSLLHDDVDKRAPAVIFLKPEELAFQIHAGADGLQGLILNFPRVAPRVQKARTPSATAGFRKWQCVLCSFAYDEALGMPEEGIAPGTRWADVPDSWTCPDCGATKSDFEMVEV
jgi:rubredoxin